MDFIAASPVIKGKQPAYMPVTMAQSSSYSSASSGSTSENEDDAYFSDVSSSSSTSVTSSSSALGDFVFDTEEEYADYFEIIQTTFEGCKKAGKQCDRAPPSYSFAPIKSASPSSYSKKSTKSKSSYRKSTSSFFLFSSSSSNASSFTSSPPQLSGSFAEQNPALKKAAQNVTAKMNKLNSYFPRETQVQEEFEDEAPACESCQDVDARFERALMFAQWNKRGRSGEWEAPRDASRGLVKLVSMTQ